MVPNSRFVCYILFVSSFFLYHDYLTKTVSKPNYMSLYILKVKKFHTYYNFFKIYKFHIIYVVNEKELWSFTKKHTCVIGRPISTTGLQDKSIIWNKSNSFVKSAPHFVIIKILISFASKRNI